TTAATVAPTTATTTTTKNPTEKLIPDVYTSYRKIAGVHVLRRVVLDRIDQRIELLRVHHVCVVVRSTTGRVDAVSKEHDSLPALNATQLLIDDHVNCIVKARAIICPGVLNCPFEFAPIGSELAEYLDVVVE